MTPGPHRDQGLPGVWEHQGLPTSGQDVAARAHLTPQPGLGLLGDTGTASALDIGPLPGEKDGPRLGWTISPWIG